MVIREMRGMSGISILEISSQPCECPVNSSKVHSKNVSVSSPFNISLLKGHKFV